MDFIAPVPFKVVRREKNQRVVMVSSQGDAAKFSHACKKASLKAQFKKGKSGAAAGKWFVRVWA